MFLQLGAELKQAQSKLAQVEQKLQTRDAECERLQQKVRELELQLIHSSTNCSATASLQEELQAERARLIAADKKVGVAGSWTCRMTVPSLHKLCSFWWIWAFQHFVCVFKRIQPSIINSPECILKWLRSLGSHFSFFLQVLELQQQLKNAQHQLRVEEARAGESSRLERDSRDLFDSLSALRAQQQEGHITRWHRVGPQRYFRPAHCFKLL